MKDKIKIILTVLCVMILQVLVIYLSHTYIANNNIYIKITFVVLVNWMIMGLSIFYLFRTHFNSNTSFKELYAKYKINTILYNLLKELTSVEETKKIYEMILKAAIKAIPQSKFGSIIMSHNGKMRFDASYGFKHEYLELIELEVEELALYRATNGKMDRPIIVHDISEENTHRIAQEKIELFEKSGTGLIRSSIAAPIVINDVVVGSINLDSKQTHVFKEEDIEILDLFALEVSKFVYLHQILEQNRNMSRYDELTKIFNRGYSIKQVKALMEEKKQFILVSADLNNLKVINDLYGHDVGDILIISFVNNMKLFLPDDAIFSRYGGDEFVTVFPNSSRTEVAVIMDDVSKFCSNYEIKECKIPINVSFSYGIVEYPTESGNYDEVLKIADERMYRHKRNYKKNIKKMQ